MSEIGRLLLEQGRARGEARAAGGARLGGAIASLSQIPGQMTAARIAEDDLAMKREAQALQRQKLQMDVAATQREQQRQSASDAIIAGALKPDGSIDREKVTALASQHDPTLVPGILTTIDKWDAARADLKIKQSQGQKADLDLADRQKDHLGGVGADLKAINYDPATFSLIVANGVRDGIFDKQVGDTLIEKAHADPAFVQTIADSWITQSPTQRKIADDARKANEPVSVGGRLVTKEGKVVYEPPPAAITPYQKAELDLQRRRLDKEGSSEPLVAIVGADGQSVLVPRSQAIGKRPANAREQGRPVTSGDAGKIAELDSSLQDLDALRTTLTETKGATGTLASIESGLPFKDIIGWGRDAAKRQATIDRVKQVIGKALEGGVLRKEDELKYEKILPTLKDDQSVAESKLNGLAAAITRKRRNDLDALSDAGYDTSRFEARGTGKTATGSSGKSGKYTWTVEQ